MLDRLLLSLHDRVPGLGVFHYVTFRAALAAATALVLSLLLGPPLIRKLNRLKMGQCIREEGPAGHQAKAGTPTMGGVLVVGSILASTFLWGDPSSGAVQAALLSMVGFGLVGAFDDLTKLLRKRNLGLSAGQKMGLLMAISLVVACLILQFHLRGGETSQLSVPFLKAFRPDLGRFLVPWICLVMVGTGNAVNLTDGLDGLAIGGMVVAAATFAILAYVAGHAGFAAHLGVPWVPGGAELTVFMGAMMGASLGFLWFNAHPAEVFMGDTGSLALGGALGTVAVLVKQECFLVISGGLFVLEAASVILQVGSYRLRGGKRIFRMAPFHHHLELGGLKETKVVARLWITAVVCSILALSSLKLR